jgi:hypothetical protein
VYRPARENITAVAAMMANNVFFKFSLLRKCLVMPDQMSNV